jgi:DNA-binding transcriptional regulator YdaS (Cro superfamily)
MDEVQYPAGPTIAAFGGTTKTAVALGLNKANVNQWKHGPSGLIPRWWSDRIKAAAVERDVKLPRPRKVKK